MVILLNKLERSVLSKALIHFLVENEIPADAHWLHQQLVLTLILIRRMHGSRNEAFTMCKVLQEAYILWTTVMEASSSGSGTI